jgi:drug/metabolite transporter superfamily protein YnfA
MSMVNGRPVAAEARLPARIPKGAIRDMLLLASIWVASLFVVNPLGDFPLNDDWSFGLAVKHLLQTGDFRPAGWTSMPLITQTLWGALFCLPGGFSFNALRFSTLVLSLCSLLTVYLLVRQVHPWRLLAAIAALTVAFNPIYYALSNTFMTDVPFTAPLLAAAFFFSRYLQGDSDFALLCGLACAVAATLCQQLGLAVPMAFAVCLLWNRGLAGRWVIRALVPLAVCLGALLTFQHWLKGTGRLPALYSLQNGELLSALCTPKRLVPGLAKHIGTALLYLGWFSLPVMVLVLPAAAAVRRGRRVFMIAGGVFILCSIIVLVLTRGPMPTAGNIVLAQGIGPLSLRDVHILNLPHVPTWGRASGWR